MSHRAGDQLGPQRIAGAVRASLDASPLVGPLVDAIEIDVRAAVVRLSGELPSVEAKRRVVALVSRSLPGGFTLWDRLRVLPFVQMEENQIGLAVCHDLASEAVLRRCALTRADGGRTTMLSRPIGPAHGRIEVSIQQGAVGLAGIVPTHLHRRVAEALSWRCLGARRVDNNLAVASGQVDGDPQLEQALRYVLGTEPLLQACAIEVEVHEQQAMLTGTAPDGPAREIAEYATWFVPGVADVHNGLVVERR